MEVLVAGKLLANERGADDMAVAFDQAALRLIRK